MKTATIIALSAVALIAAAPVSAKTGSHHKVAWKHRPDASGGAPWHEMRGSRRGYSGAFGYAPAQSGDYTIGNSRQAGGGGGGGGGGSGM